MKIVEIIPNLNVSSGGAEVLLVNLCLALSKKGEEIVLLTLYEGISDRFAKKISNSNIKLIQLSKHKGLDFSCAKDLKNAINSIKPDIVHFHLGVVLTYYLAFGFKKVPWKTFCTIHSVPKMDESFVGTYLRKRYARKKLIQFIGISSLITNEAIKTYKNDDIFTIENGFELAKANYTATKIYDLICVAVFKPAKNHKLLFDALINLNESGNKITLACVGAGPMFEEMKKYVFEHNATSYISLLGQQNNVSKYLSEAKCFILSSNYEGNPISILEALGSGLPVIAPSVGGIPDIISNYENGILFEAGDLQQLQNAILTILSDLALQEKMSKNNLSKSKEYSIDNCAQKYLNAFTKSL